MKEVGSRMTKKAGNGAVKSKFVYAAVLAVTAAAAVTHEGEFTRFLAGFELVLAAALFLCMRLLSKSIRAELSLPELCGQRNRSFQIRLNIKNACPLPAADLMVELVCRDLYSGAERMLRSSAMADGKGEAELVFLMGADHCSGIEVISGSVRVRDYFGLFSGSCSLSFRQNGYTVLPVWSVSGKECGGENRYRTSGGNEDTASGGKRGTSEVADIRAFQEGDGIHSIHWKLSARFDELMVRQEAASGGTSVILFFDLYRGEKNKISRHILDRFYDEAAAGSRSLLESGCSHETVWINGEELVRIRVVDEESYTEMLTMLVRTPLGVKAADPEEIYRERYGNETYRKAGKTSFVHIQEEYSGKTE